MLFDFKIIYTANINKPNLIYDELLFIDDKFIEKVDMTVEIKQNKIKKIKYLFLNIFKFLFIYKIVKKFRIIITKNKSGINGPVISAIGIKKNKMDDM